MPACGPARPCRRTAGVGFFGDLELAEGICAVRNVPSARAFCHCQPHVHPTGGGRASKCAARRIVVPDLHDVAQNLISIEATIAHRWSTGWAHKSVAESHEVQALTVLGLSLIFCARLGGKSSYRISAARA